MHALHSTLLPPSAVHHSLFLPNFTPSTIYPLPKPSTSTADVKVVGNLVVGGKSDLRVFEIRESLMPVIDASQPNGSKDEINGVAGANGAAEIDGMDEDFYDTGPLEVRKLYACLICPQAHPSVRLSGMRRAESCTS